METEEILAAIQEAAKTIATPNWATVISAIASVGAVISAVVIAIKQVGISNKQSKIAQNQAEISDQQNRIALFEKQYEVYCELFKMISIGNQLDYPGTHSRFSLLHEIEVIYGVNFTDGENLNAQLRASLAQIKKSEYIVKQSAFLFGCIDEKDIDKLVNTLMDCMIFILKSNSEEINIKEHDIDEFIKVSNNFTSKYLNSMEAELSLIRGA